MQLYACFPWPVETMATGTLHESRSRVPAVLLSIHVPVSIPRFHTMRVSRFGANLLKSQSNFYENKPRTYHSPPSIHY